jgi:dihydrodipicolinate synthase/N-acetylneuraminate lyase
MTTALLRRVLDIPQFVGMKNDSGDFYEHCEYLRTVMLQGARFVPMTGGSMMSFVHGRLFGAQAFAVAVGMYAPHVPIAFTRYLDEGQEEKAVELIRQYEEPLLELELAESLTHDDHRTLYRTLLMLCGHFRTNRVRFPTQTCDKNAVDAIKRLLVDQGLL